jgi:hypothetical protein
MEENPRFLKQGVAAVDIIDFSPFKTYHHTAQDKADKMQSGKPGHCRLCRVGHPEGTRGQIRHGPRRHATTTRSWRSTLKHLARSFVLLLIVTCAWRYGRESVHTWLAHAARPAVAPVPSSMGLPSGEHYSPAEDLERLDYQAIRGARRSLDIAMYSFTDIPLAEAVREAGRRGIRGRIYRDGDEYEREQARARRYRSAMQTLLREANIRIRVKPSGREYMHLNYVI